MPVRPKPRQPERWKFFSWIGALLRGIFAHARVFQGDVAEEGDIAEMTLTDDLRLRVSDVASMLMALGGGSGIKFSPVYFTAAYHDADELLLTGLPTLPDNVQFVGVIEWTTTNVNYWFQPTYHCTFDPATSRLQVAGATFAAGSEFMAIYVEEQNAYDQVLDAIQDVQLNAREQDYIDTQTIADAEDITNPFTCDPVIVKAQTTIGLYVTWTTGAAAGAYTLDILGLAYDEDTGGNAHEIQTGDWEYQAVPAANIAIQGSTLRFSGVQATTYRFFCRIDVNDINRWAATFTEGVPGADHTTLTCEAVIMNR